MYHMLKHIVEILYTKENNGAYFIDKHPKHEMYIITIKFFLKLSKHKYCKLA